MSTEKIIKVLTMIYNTLGYTFIAIGVINVVLFFINLFAGKYLAQFLFLGIAFAVLGFVILYFKKRAIKKIKKRDNSHNG